MAEIKTILTYIIFGIFISYSNGSVLEDAYGKDFIFTFPTQSNPPRPYEPKLVITVTSPSTTFVTVTFPLLNDNIIERIIDPGQYRIVDLPPEVISDPNELFQIGTVKVHSDHDVSVIALSYVSLGPNMASFQVLPISGLGKEYVVIDWPSSADTYPAEFLITSLYNDTNIHYILTTPPASSYPREDTILLQEYESVQFHTERTTGLDFTGSRIWSDKPISVIGGCACADIPLDPITSCDYVASQLIPFEKWGQFHSLVPFRGRENAGFVIRVVAARNDTSLIIDNDNAVLLNAGNSHEKTHVSSDIVTVAADKPILVAQYAMSSSSDNLGDPLMLIVPPIEQYVDGIIFTLFNSSRFEIAEDSITISIGCDYVNGILFDNLPLDNSWAILNDAESFMCAAQNTISDVSVHNISHVIPDTSMSALIYGFGSSAHAVSYGHSVAFGLDNVTCTVFDDISNSTREVSCHLVEPVDIHCPDDITKSTETGVNYAIVDWTPVTANDSSGFLDVVCSHENGGRFYLGDTIVICVAQEFGYIRANCSFQVSVTDTELPNIFDCPEDITDYAVEDEEVPVYWEEPYCDDNSGDCTLTTESEPGQLFGFGDNGVWYKGVDGSGNTAYCNFTVIIIPRCRESQTTHGPGIGTLTWPSTTVYETTESAERCLVTTERRGLGFGTRTCGPDVIKGAMFEDPVFESIEEPCGAEDEPELEDLANTPVVESNVEEIAETLADVTEKTQTTTDDVTSVSTTIQNIVNVGTASSKVTISVIETVDNLLDTTEKPQDNDHETASNSSSQIILSLERQVALTISGEGPIKAVQPSLAVQAISVNETSSQEGIGFLTKSKDTLNSVLDGDDSAVSFVNATEVPDEEIQTSITLPSSLPTDDLGFNASFLVFQQEDLFISEKLINDSSMNILGAIASVEIHGVNTSNLTVPVRIEMLPFKSCITESNINSTRCVYWDFTLRDGIGDWAEDGCVFVGYINGRVVCQCHHLTNFAAIAGKYIRSKALDTISVVGCSLSLASLIVTLGIFFYFKKLRQSEPRQIIIQLCISLFFLYLTYIILFAIDNHTSYDSKCATQKATASCITLAAFLHYFTLTTLMWMAVEARMLYRLLVIVFGQKSGNPFKYYFVTAWGTPIVVVGITLGAGWKYYQHLEHCFVAEWPLYLAIAIPVALVIGHNIAIFIFVLRSLLKSRVKGKMDADKSKELWQRLRHGLCIMLLIGLTWVFGLFAIRSGEAFFGWLFVLFNSIQGMGIFIVFCILQEDVKKTLKPYFTWVRLPQRCTKTPEEPQSVTEKYTHKSEFSTSGADSSNVVSDLSRFEPSYEMTNSSGNGQSGLSNPSFNTIDDTESPGVLKADTKLQENDADIHASGLENPEKYPDVDYSDSSNDE